MTKRPEMIARCVRAVRDSEAWSSFWNDDDAEALVRALLTELRRPTAAMITAGRCELPQVEGREIAHAWQTMIDAAHHD